MQLFVQLPAATVGENHLNVYLRIWAFLIGCCKQLHGKLLSVLFDLEWKFNQLISQH